MEKVNVIRVGGTNGQHEFYRVVVETSKPKPTYLGPAILAR